MLVLAPWGVDSGDVLGSLSAAFFGFQVGGVTVSLSTIAISIALFFVALFITRAIQGWLEGTYLPSTALDIGLRNSIKTIFGYIGFIVASVFALGYMGISLDKVTLVAGALSSDPARAKASAPSYDIASVACPSPKCPASGRSMQ